MPATSACTFALGLRLVRQVLAELLIRRRHFFELPCRLLLLGAWVLVRMILQCEAPVSLLDRGLVGARRQAQDLEVLLDWRRSSLGWRRCLLARGLLLLPLPRLLRRRLCTGTWRRCRAARRLRTALCGLLPHARLDQVGQEGLRAHAGSEVVNAGRLGSGLAAGAGSGSLTSARRGTAGAPLRSGSCLGREDVAVSRGSRRRGECRCGELLHHVLALATDRDAALLTEALQLCHWQVTPDDDIAEAGEELALLRSGLHRHTPAAALPL
mmetsp:Transcript_802/g.2199  ORF Transcript_802/g.2199 Transcript_802/m.2199 type:complete len:269 (+) Transcript_802:140-946(+)